MIARIEEDGYAATSLTGAYPGMYCRDTSIQIMAHTVQGDYDYAKKLIGYILKYHKERGCNYLLHVMYNDPERLPFATEQSDTTYFFLHAWYQFVTTAPKTAENISLIKNSYPQVKTFADYYLNKGYLNNKYNLLFNACLEHSRKFSFWQGYDLLTNVYASQVYHEISLYFAEIYPESSKRWADAADTIVKGIYTNLVTEIDGKTIYSELIGRTKKEAEENPNVPEPVLYGFSWVNLAPIGCDWYATEPEILENTYEMYKKYGSCVYYNDRYVMLEVDTEFTGTPITEGNYILGKGLAWEMMYCKKMGYTDRLKTLVVFLEEFSEDMYRETWGYHGGGSDTANQEHASWMLYANKICFPELEG